MLTLTKGFKKPESGDKGSVFFPALEDNIQQLNDHTHNGSDSQLLTASSSAAVTQAIASGSWTHISGGTYRQTVTMPGVIAYDTHCIQFRKDTTGEILYLSTQKVSSNSYYVFCNDSTLDVLAVYT